MRGYEYFDHAADVGMHIRGSSLPELFLAGAQALMEWIGPPPEGQATLKDRVLVDAEKLDDLLVRWLQEVLFLFHQRHAYFTGAESIDIRGFRLAAVVKARIWDEAQAPLDQEVKAVTYHRLELSSDGAGWRASVILDV